MIDCDFGDLVIVPFPFLDLRTKKRRPALVLSALKPERWAPYSILAMVTSQVSGEGLPGDIHLENWQSANLLHPSKARLSKLVSVENSLILKKLGKLSEGDRRACFSAFGQVFESILRLNG